MLWGFTKIRSTRFVLLLRDVHINTTKTLTTMIICGSGVLFALDTHLPVAVKWATFPGPSTSLFQLQLGNAQHR